MCAYIQNPFVYLHACCLVWSGVVAKKLFFGGVSYASLEHALYKNTLEVVS